MDFAVNPGANVSSDILIYYKYLHKQNILMIPQIWLSNTCDKDTFAMEPGYLMVLTKGIIVRNDHVCLHYVL